MTRNLDALRAIAAATRKASELEANTAALRASARSAERDLQNLAEQIAAAEGSLAELGDRPFDWGDLDRTTPISALWGEDRGHCVDRVYIDAFVEEHAGDIAGRVLEIYDRDYTLRYGGTRVRESDVLDIDASNPRASIVGDLRQLTSIAARTFDCLIVTQTLQLIFDIERALAECARILRPGGTILATLPCASRIAPEQGLDGDFWRFTPSSAERLFQRHFSPGQLQVRSRGNLVTTIAFLYGVAAHELDAAAFQHNDPLFPLVITVRARTPPADE